MSNSPHSELHDQALPLEDALALYRRIGVLRHHGRVSEAEELSSEQLNPALDRLKSAGEISTEEIDRRLQEERRRVEDAVLLAELLAPLLKSQIGVMPSPSINSPSKERASQPSVRSSSPVRKPGSQPIPITAFIDEMLSQEKPNGGRS